MTLTWANSSKEASRIRSGLRDVGKHILEEAHCQTTYPYGQGNLRLLWRLLSLCTRVFVTNAKLCYKKAQPVGDMLFTSNGKFSSAGRGTGPAQRLGVRNGNHIYEGWKPRVWNLGLDQKSTMPYECSGQSLRTSALLPQGVGVTSLSYRIPAPPGFGCPVTDTATFSPTPLAAIIWGL